MEMAADRDGVFVFPACCWPGSCWGTQGSKAGGMTVMPVPGACAGVSTLQGPARQKVPGIFWRPTGSSTGGIWAVPAHTAAAAGATGYCWGVDTAEGCWPHPGCQNSLSTPARHSLPAPHLLHACSSQGTSSAMNLTAVDLIVYSSNTRPIYKSFHPITFYLIWMFRCQSK